MSESREFHVATVVSAITGRLLAPNGMSDIYDICEFVSGEKGLMTHQLPRVMDEMEPYLKEQFPELSKIEIPDGLDTFEKIFTWFDLNIYDRFGETLKVTPMPPEAHTHINPIAELKMKAPHMKIFTIGNDGLEQV